jgi:hypothetical protein
VPAALAVLLSAGALTTGVVAAPASAAPAAATRVSLFPSDALTVPDATQWTGRRVSLPTAGCGGVTTCGLVNRLNELDGFDLDPRLALDFDGPVDLAKVIASTTVTPVEGGPSVGIDRVVYDATTQTVYAHPQQQLRGRTAYRLAVSSARGLPRAATTFTTLSAADGLVDMRRQLDSGVAFADAGIAAGQRGLRIDATVPVAGTTFTYVEDRGSAGGLQEVDVPVVASGTVVFGSYLAPQWLREDRTIPQSRTKKAGPRAQESARLPFVLVLPTGTAPAGGWPTAVYGHGFTRSDRDVLLAATANSNTGVATIATDVVGHGFGPRSTWTYTRNGTTRTLPAYARGIDQDGDGQIGSTEGSSTLITGEAAAVSSRDALRQTAADVMTLVRAVGRGLDVSGSPASELRRADVSYFGHSFGGIYGTMLAGADPTVHRAALSVPGGPITEIARLSPAFRPLITFNLKVAGLLNCPDPAQDCFVESLPLRGEAPVRGPAAGALPIQNYLAQATWLARQGSPEAYAPLIQDSKVLFQVAYGDQTVPNPTSYTLLAAGDLFDRASLYRNDRTPQAAENPHGFLLNPAVFLEAFFQGQAQIQQFLTAGTVLDPDGPTDVWVVPIARPASLLTLNFTAP